MSEETKCPRCPWCGAEGFITGLSIRVENCPYYEWRCGSWKKGVEPWQSDECKINVLTAANERLTEDLTAARAEIDRRIDDGQRKLLMRSLAKATGNTEEELTCAPFGCAIKAAERLEQLHVQLAGCREQCRELREIIDPAISAVDGTKRVGDDHYEHENAARRLDELLSSRAKKPEHLVIDWFVAFLSAMQIGDAHLYHVEREWIVRWSCTVNSRRYALVTKLNTTMLEQLNVAEDARQAWNYCRESFHARFRGHL